MALTAEKIEQIINKLGRDADFVLVDRSYSPQTGRTEIVSSTTYTRRIVPPYDYSQAFGGKNTDHSSKAKIAVSTKDLPFIPFPGIDVVFDGSRWEVLEVEPISGPDSILMYILTITTRSQDTGGYGAGTYGSGDYGR